VGQTACDFTVTLQKLLLDASTKKLLLDHSAWESIKYNRLKQTILKKMKIKPVIAQNSYISIFYCQKSIGKKNPNKNRFYYTTKVR
jgi:hypothetical protein